MKYTTIVFERDIRYDIERIILEALSEGRHVKVSLDHLPSLEIDDVRRLIKLLRQTRNTGVEFQLHASRPDVRKVLAVTALDQVFTVTSDAA